MANFKYREQKRQNTLSRLTGRNRTLDNNKPVAYANTIYDPTVDNPELNDVDDRTRSLKLIDFMTDAIKNEIQEPKE